MREIEFRTWDKKDKVMRSWEEVILIKEYGDDFLLEGYKENEGITSFDHEQILMQFTGLLDKNGKKIYEGDVVKCKMHNKTYENYVISWCSEDASFEALNVDKSNFIDATIWCKCEIIGNIHVEVQERKLKS